jgi:transposase-like protein
MVAERRTAEMGGARRATGVSAVSDPAAGRRDLHAVPDPEVPEKAARRRFTAAYKLRILKEAQACKGTSQCGALLRREGFYSSHLTTWRRQVEKITLEALSPRKRGPKAAPPNPLKKRVETLEKETQRLRHQLKQAEIIIEVQKTISEILHLPPDPKGEER